MKKKIKAEKSRVILKEALLNLLLESDFSKITIQDICKEAKLGRSTFYNHYNDKLDLLKETVTFYSQIAKDTTYYAFLEEDRMDLRANLLRDYQTTIQYSQIIKALLSVHLPEADFEADIRDMLRSKYKVLLSNSQPNDSIPEELAIELYTSNALLVTKHIAYHADTADIEKLADFMFTIYQSLFKQMESSVTEADSDIETEEVSELAVKS